MKTNEGEYDLEHYLEWYQFLKNKLPAGFSIFNYDLSDDIEIYDSLFEFIFESLSHEWINFYERPCYFYYIGEFKDSVIEKTRAYAENCGDFNVIGIKYNLIKDLFSLFSKQSQILSNLPEVKKYSIESLLNLQIGALIYRLSVSFLYYHELAHIMQFSPNERQRMSEDCVSMYLTKSDTLSKHTKEMDADYVSARLTTKIVIDYWKDLPKKQRQVEILEFLISITLVGVFILWDYLSSGISEVYFLEKSHPHEVIRISAMSNSILNELDSSEEIKVNSEKILRRTFEILQTLNRNEPILIYLNTVTQKRKNLDEYWQELEIQARLYKDSALNKLSNPASDY